MCTQETVNGAPREKHDQTVVFLIQVPTFQKCLALRCIGICLPRNLNCPHCNRPQGGWNPCNIELLKPPLLPVAEDCLQVRGILYSLPVA